MDVTTQSKTHIPAVTLGRSPAVRAAAHRALAARDLLVSGYPLWEDWCRQARAGKTEAVARLDELLDDLARAVTAWAGRVLRARAAQALKHVHRRGPGLVSWLTDPNRTADLEKVLVLAARGPLTSEIILYREEA